MPSACRGKSPRGIDSRPPSDRNEGGRRKPRPEIPVARAGKVEESPPRCYHGPLLMSSFADFGLLPTLEASIVEKGLETPTEIQTRAVPALLEGKSVIGLSPTG